ncbi:hypothetical protein [Nocardiopsis synnemataformans]|uniref:hypothetical protein n=1 Tax=Nocardiopsis synnemataformans TaxID=61305 RepID=UPI003EBEB1D2
MQSFTQPLPGVSWTSAPRRNGRTYSTAAIGHVATTRATVPVVLTLDPDWFAKGRAKGRAEDMLTAGLTITDGDKATIVFHVEHADADPRPYLAAALSVLARYRPTDLPDLQWKTRPTSDEHTAYETEIAAFENTVTGMTTIVFALFYPALLDGLQSDPADMSMFITRGNRRDVHLPVVSTDVTLPKLNERIRTAPWDLG